MVVGLLVGLALREKVVMEPHKKVAVQMPQPAMAQVSLDRQTLAVAAPAGEGVIPLVLEVQE
jgi:hypothetical protein